MKGQGDLIPWFFGPGGGMNNAGCDRRLFGLLAYSQFPVAGVGIQLTNTATHVVYGTYTDAQGWYRCEGIPAGNYSLVVNSTAYATRTLSSLVMPNAAGHYGVIQLSKPATNLQPAAHQVIASRIPTFSWTGTPESVSYSISVRNFTSGLEIFACPNVMSTSLPSPVALADGSYFWSVLGYDCGGNLVVTGGARFDVQVP